MNYHEELWRGDFGTTYHQRNNPEAARSMDPGVLERFWGKPQVVWENVDSVLELGAGLGANLASLKRSMPRLITAGVEINRTAFNAMWPRVDLAWQESIVGHEPHRQFDLVITKGVLVHVPEQDLLTVFQTISDCGPNQVLFAEYYGPRREVVRYREQAFACWRDDYASRFVEFDPSFEVADYGFVWHGDSECPQDDLTYFLLSRT